MVAPELRGDSRYSHQPGVHCQETECSREDQAQYLCECVDRSLLQRVPSYPSVPRRIVAASIQRLYANQSAKRKEHAKWS
eukprot:2885025-Rhodomonas_salina.2